MNWVKLLRHLTLWEAVNTAPRGAISRWITLWSVGFMSFWVGWATWRVFGSNPPEIGAGAATAYATLLGTGLAGAWAVYRWARGDTNAPYRLKNEQAQETSSDYPPRSRF